MLLDETQAGVVAEAIRHVEMGTDAELVTVLARRSDNYNYIPTLWAALVAMATPLLTLVVPAWLNTQDIILLQLLVFVLVAAALRLPWLHRLVVPARVRAWRCSNMARRQFLEQGLHHTRDAMGVLVFVSEFEHHVEIIADRGIASQVPDSRWQAIIDAFTAAVRRGDTVAGFTACVASCGEILAEVAPATRAKDELPNHLVVIDVD